MRNRVKCEVTEGRGGEGSKRKGRIQTHADKSYQINGGVETSIHRSGM